MKYEKERRHYNGVKSQQDLAGAKNITMNLPEGR